MEYWVFLVNICKLGREGETFSFIHIYMANVFRSSEIIKKKIYLLLTVVYRYR